MNKLFLFVLICLFSQTTSAQIVRGAIEPVSKDYVNYKTYSLKLNLNGNVEKTMTEYKTPYSLQEFEGILGIGGMKQTFSDAEFKINYNLVRYVLVDAIRYEKGPAFHIGIESNLEIFDKDNKLIYKRYTKPSSKLYLTDLDTDYGKVTKKIIIDNFSEMFTEFEQFYLYTPKLAKFESLKIEKRKKPEPNFSVEDFAASREVFPALENIDRKDWAKVLEEAQKYWLPLTKYNEKAAKNADGIRTAAAYNLVLSYILTDKIEDAKKMVEIVRADESKSFGFRDYSPTLNDYIELIEKTKNSSERNDNILSIAPTPIYPEYLKNDSGFQYAEFNGEVVKQDGKSFKGRIKLLNNMPAIVSLRAIKESGGGALALAGALLDASEVYNSDVEIYIEGKKKPERTTLKKVAKIIDMKGNTYTVGKVGRGILVNTGEYNDRRFALMGEVKKQGSISLYEEFFPQNDLAFKKDSEDKFYTPPAFLGKKKSMKAYFACPALDILIDKSTYKEDTKEIYIGLFNDFSEKCK